MVGKKSSFLPRNRKKHLAFLAGFSGTYAANKVNKALSGVKNKYPAVKTGEKKILPTRIMTFRRGRRTRRRRSGRRSRRVRHKGQLVTPYSVVRRIPCSWFNSLNPGAGTLSLDILKMNSAYDPTGTISPSLQGMGMDQYEALYNRYCVVGYKLHIQAVCADNSNAVTIGFTPTTTSSTLTSQHRYMEQKGTVFKVMTPDIDKITMTIKGSCKKWLLPRGGKLLSDDGGHGSTMTSDPTKILYGHLWVQAQDNAADPGIIGYTAKLEQLVVFYDPKTPARSTQ